MGALGTLGLATNLMLMDSTTETISAHQISMLCYYANTELSTDLHASVLHSGSQNETHSPHPQLKRIPQKQNPSTPSSEDPLESYF